MNFARTQVVEIATVGDSRENCAVGFCRKRDDACFLDPFEITREFLRAKNRRRGRAGDKRICALRIAQVGLASGFAVPGQSTA